jgi:hypothetical protein
MLLVLAVVSFCLGVSAQTTGTEVTAGQTQVQLTNQNSRVLFTPFLLAGATDTYRKSQLSASENYLVYSTDASNNVCPNVVGNTTCYPSLYSVSTYSNSANDKKLSGVTATGGLGVEPSWVITPGQGYVVWGGQITTAGTWELWSSQIGGGNAPGVKLSPTNAVNSLINNAAIANLIFRPSTRPVYPFPSFGTDQDSQLLMTVPTQAGTPITGPPLIPRDANELWVNNVPGNGGNPPWKISTSVGPEGANKVVRVVSVTQNWIIYTANNGSSAAFPSTDPRNVFMTNWQGTQTFQLNPASTVARSDTTPLSCPWKNDFWNPQCSTLYSPNYNFVAVRDFADNVNFPTLRIFSVSSGQLLNGGSAINVPVAVGSAGVTSVWWSWDSTKVFWSSAPGSNPLQNHLYMWDVTVGTGSATQITPTVADGGGFFGSVHITQNPPMIVFQVAQATSTSTTMLYAYNFAGGSSAVLRTINPAVTGPGTFQISNIIVLPSVQASNPYVTFVATVTNIQSNIYSYQLLSANAALTPTQISPTLVANGVIPQVAQPQSYITNQGNAANDCYIGNCNGATGRAYVVAAANGVSATVPTGYCIPQDATSNAGAVTITPTGVAGPLFFAQFNTYTPALNSSGPFVYSAVQPTAPPTPGQYYVSNCGTGAIIQLSRTAASPQASTTLGTLVLSPDRKWAAFTSNSNNANLNDIYALPADGSTDPVNVIPALGSTQRVTGTYSFTTDSKYLTVVRADSAANNSRTTLFNAPMSAPLSSTKVLNLTPAYTNFPNGDPLGGLSFFGTAALGQTYANNGFWYTMQWPNAVNINNVTSPTAVYTISENGGNTVRLSWNTTTPILRTPQAATASFRVFFFGDTGTVAGLGGDAYVNAAFASSLLPCAAVALFVLLALAL